MYVYRLQWTHSVLLHWKKLYQRSFITHASLLLKWYVCCTVVTCTHIRLHSFIVLKVAEEDPGHSNDDPLQTDLGICSRTHMYAIVKVYSLFTMLFVHLIFLLVRVRVGKSVASILVIKYKNPLHCYLLDMDMEELSSILSKVDHEEVKSMMNKIAQDTVSAYKVYGTRLHWLLQYYM